MKNLTESLLKEVLSTVKDAKKFTLKQAPAVCQEIIKLGRFSSTGAVAIGIVGLITTISLVIHFGNQLGWAGECYGGYAALAGLLPAIVFFVLVSANINEMLMTWIAPKTYIIKRLNNIRLGVDDD